MEKYQAVYQSWQGYGDKTHGREAIETGFLAELAPISLLDVGCGSNMFANEAMRAMPGLVAVGADLVCEDADFIRPAHKLDFAPDGAFDLVTAFDVLEHLLTDEIDAVLDEFRRVSTRFLFSIAHFECDHKGHRLHMTVQDERWWYEKIGHKSKRVMRRPRVTPRKPAYWLGEWR